MMVTLTSSLYANLNRRRLTWTMRRRSTGRCQIAIEPTSPAPNVTSLFTRSGPYVILVWQAEEHFRARVSVRVSPDSVTLKNVLPISARQVGWG